MNIKDAYIHNGDAILKDIKVENSALKKILAGKKADDTYLGWETVCDLTGIKPNTAGTADKVGHKLTFSGGVTGTWDGSADKTVTIPTKSSWNYDDVYLKLTGNGTTNPLTGTIYIKDVNGIILNSKDKDLNIWEVYGNSGAWTSQYGFNLQYIGTGSGNNNDLILWAHNQNGTHIESYRVKQDGTFIFKAAPKVGTNAMYHAGNLTASVIGGLGTLSNNISGNAATATDADLLDGVHYQNILERPKSGYTTSGTATGWFRIAEALARIDDGVTFLLAIQRNYNYTNNESYLFSISISYNGGISITQLSGYANTRLITKIRVDWANSQIAYVDLYINTSSTDNHYYWYTVGCAKSYTAWIANPTLVGHAYEFTTVQGCKSDRGFTGDIVGNASSATKLANSRTIWGQSFDGTGNVSGAMTGVTSIEASGVIYSNKYNSSNNASVAAFIINKGSDYFGIGTSLGGVSNVGFGLTTDTNGTWKKEFMTITNGGDVGIGTISPSYKLHVAGSILSDLGNSGGVLIGHNGNTIDGYANGTLTDLHINYTSSGNLTICNGGGNVGIGTANPSYKLHVVGDIYTTTGFKKEGSSDSYVLLGGGGHKAISDFATASHIHSNYIERLAWWNEEDSHNANDLLSGTTFAYHNHSNCPTTGTIVAFNCINSGYQLQLQGSYYREELWFRNRNGDNGTWNAWRYIIHNGNIGSQSVNYASSAGSATTSTYASNVGSSGTAGTNYVTAANVISMYNWYNSITATDDASNTAIDKWNEIVSFLAGITDTSTLSGILAGYAAADHTHPYLPLSGGTLTSSSLTNILDLNGSAGIEVGIRFLRNSVPKGWIGYMDGGYMYMYNAQRANYLRYNDNGTLTFEGNTIWHEGNDGSGSGLDADLLDGYHETSFYRHRGSYGKSYTAASIEYNLDSGTYITEEQGYSGTLLSFNSSGSASSIQFWTHYSQGYLYYRTSIDSNRWGKTDGFWTRILDSDSYTEYTVKKDGTGASGTWEISITGNAATATSASNADTLNNIDSTGFLRQVVVPNNAENDFNTFSNMTLTGRVDPTTGALLKNAPWTGRGPAGGYGVLTYLFDKHSASYGTQIAVGYNSNKIYIRNRYWGDSGVVWGTTWDSLALTSEVTNLLSNYLPLSGGTMSNTNVVTNLNADLLDGKHATNFLAWTSMQNIGSSSPFQDAVNFFNNLDNLNNGGKLVYNHAGAEYTELFTRRNDSTAHGTILKWGYTDNYIRIIRMIFGKAQSTDWEKISAGYADIAGSVAWDNVTGKPTTISGYGITDALTTKSVIWKNDYERYVILLCKIGTNSTNKQHTINGTFWTTSGGVSRYQAAYINVHCSDWSNDHNEYYMFTPFGLGTKSRLITCIYQSNQYLAITFENIQATSIYFDGSYDNILFTPVLYYIDNTSTVKNSEIYNSISEVVYKKLDIYELPESTATYSLSNAAWTNTIILPTTAGSYILNIVSGNSTLTGVFSIGASDNAKDEISLHLHGNGPRLYARTNGTTLQLSSNDASATSRSVTIKYRRII